LTAPSSPPRNIAHRGSSRFCPENTWPAFERAVEVDGAEGIELDAHLGADGELYVLHDPTVDRTTDGHGRLRDLDAATIAKLDAGYHFTDPQGEHSHRGAGVRLPRLREVLGAFPSTWFSIDLKEGGAGAEEALARILLELDCGPRCVIGAENPEAAHRLRALLPPPQRHFFDRRSVQEFYLRHRLHWWWSYEAPADSLQIPTRGRGWALDRPGLLRDARTRGISVFFWTIDDPAEMRRLLELGADGIITNRPDLLRDLLPEEPGT
jgi:glycerophosphoryl diester phosphodiesterase